MSHALSLEWFIWPWTVWIVKSAAKCGGAELF